MYKYEEADRIWVRKARRGDPKAFARLYGKIYQDLYRFALYMMKNPQDAEDMVSEAVMAAYENIGKLEKDASFGNWMFRILSNCCKKRLVSGRKEAEASGKMMQEESALEMADPGSDYAKSQDVRDAFFTLSEEERFIVGLSVFGGYKSNEIAKVLELKPATVRSKRSRAFQKMRDRLGKECCYES